MLGTPNDRLYAGAGVAGVEERGHEDKGGDPSEVWMVRVYVVERVAELVNFQVFLGVVLCIHDVQTR